jgi:transposase-like protein
MPVAKGEKKIQYTPEQRADIVERVCALYESQNATVESCCNQCGISQAVFYLWTAQFVEIGERYKKAKIKADDFWFENVLVPKAKRASELLLEEREIEESKDEEVVHQGLKSKDDNGNPLTKKTVTKSKQQPNATLAIFAMKGAMPDKFREKIEHSGPAGGPIQFDGLTTQEKADLLALLQKSKSGG